jgi:CheY-like chemotaxis protein
VKAWQVLALTQMSQGSVTDWIEHPNQEDLEHVALEKALPEDRRRIESHLNECESCQRGFEEALKCRERLKEMLREQGRPDQRRGVRYRVRESAIIRCCRPAEVAPLIGQVMDVSATGLRVRLPRAIYRGTAVQVQVENAIVFGTIRYCRDAGDKRYDIGIAVEQVVMRQLQRSFETELREHEHGGAREPGRNVALQPVEVLLVEDNPADIKLMQLMFESIELKCTLSVALDGAQALRRLFDPSIPKPSLVLLDLNLPKLSGLDALKTLREDGRTKSVAVAVLSSSTAEADLQRTTALGIRAYLPKPQNILGYENLRTNLTALLSDALS